MVRGKGIVATRQGLDTDFRGGQQLATQRVHVDTKVVHPHRQRIKILTCSRNQLRPKTEIKVLAVLKQALVGIIHTRLSAYKLQGLSKRPIDRVRFLQVVRVECRSRVKIQTERHFNV